MAKFILILTILSSFASILGFLFIQIIPDQRKIHKRIMIVVFIICVLLSVYTLLVPGTFLEQNVKNKLVYYSSNTDYEEVNDILVQKGKFRIDGFNPLSVEFEKPFAEIPEVEIINYRGFNEDYVPFIKRVTTNQVIFKNGSVGGWGPKTFRWVAKGKPLYPAKFE